jgi:dCTP deaminase
MILTDTEILERCVGSNGMITPFIPTQIKKGVISYGLSSCGYDFRLSNKFIAYSDISTHIILDPKEDNKEIPIDKKETDTFIMPPHSFVLAMTKEKINLPDNICASIYIKSTYARLGVVGDFPLIDPGYKGYLTLRLCNPSKLQLKLYSNEGIVQVVFHELSDSVGLNYEKQGGRYQNSKSIRLANVTKN